MPGLERSATSLESCGLHRALSATSSKRPRSIKTRRKLYTTFWQHGAADIELSNAWKYGMPPTQTNSTGSMSAPIVAQHEKFETSNASPFLLDSLFLKGGTSLLRTFSPGTLDRHEKLRPRVRKSTARPYTSTASVGAAETSPGAVQQGGSDRFNDLVLDSRASTIRAVEADETNSGIKMDLSHTPPSTVWMSNRSADLGPSSELDPTQRLEQHPEHTMGTTKAFDTSLTDEGDLQPDSKHAANPPAQAIEGLASLESALESAKHTETSSRDLDSSQEWGLASENAETLKALLAKDRASSFDRIWMLGQSTDFSMDPGLHESYLDYALRYRSTAMLTSYTLRRSTFQTWHDCMARRLSRREPLDFQIHEFQTSITGLEDIGQRLQSLWTVSATSAENHQHQALFTIIRDEIMRPVVDTLMTTMDAESTRELLAKLGDATLYEAHIAHCVETESFTSAAQSYERYRILPNVKIRKVIMGHMTRDVFFPYNLKGMETVLEDWYLHHGALDDPIFRRFLSFYAIRGDVTSLKRLWDKQFADRRQFPRIPRYMYPQLLLVQAYRGDVAAATSLFDEVLHTYGDRVSVAWWNIMLKTYAEANFHDEAIELFDILRQSRLPNNRPNSHTFATMMGMSSGRGDLAYTIQIYQEARNHGIIPSPPMLEAILEAHCQNGQYAEAEDLCRKFTLLGKFKKHRYAILWNVLLRHHAERRDLVAMNRLLTEMTQHKIPYSSSTYKMLLAGLANCKQGAHALRLVQTARLGGTFKATYQHYIMVTSAFVRSGDIDAALRVLDLLRELGYPETGDALIAVIRAYSAFGAKYRNADIGHIRESLINALQRLRDVLLTGEFERGAGAGQADDDQSLTAMDEPSVVNKPLHKMEQIRLLMFFFTQMQDFATTDEILKIWQATAVPDKDGQTETPLELLDSLLLSAFYQNQSEKVHELWEHIFEQALRKSRPKGAAAGNAISPRFRYVLRNSIKIMMKSYRQQNDAPGLMALVARVQEAGFRLNGQGWNTYVQLLNELHKWQDAFALCEQHLMPQWTGWKQTRRFLPNINTRLPLEVRRMGSDPRIAYPTSMTLMKLAKSYLGMKAAMVFSSEASRVTSFVEENCPVLLKAITTMRREHSAEELAIFEGSGRESDTAVIPRRRLFKLN